MPLTSYEKSRARLQAKPLRAEAALQNPAANLELIRHFPAAQFRGKTIGAYWPIKDELDIRPLISALQAQGETLALPAILRKHHPLEFRAYTANTKLERGPHGTYQPPKSAAVLTPDIILMPLLAFTHDGERLGYGGGYYDRTLASLRKTHDVFACGVAFAAQEAQSLPTEAHDMRMDGILTEKEFRRF